MEKFYKVKDNKIFINVYVVPNASKDEIKEIYDSFLKIKISSPAVDGKANKSLINFLSKYFKIPKSKIKIFKGEKNRKKVLILEDLKDDVLKKLEEVENANI